MFKKLAAPFLVLTLAAAFNACSSDSGSSGGTGGKTGTGGAGTGGAGTGGAGTGGAGTGGAGTGGAGTGGAAVDAGSGGAAVDAPPDVPAGGDTAADTGGEAGGADFCATYVAGSNMVAGISAATFCEKYATTCTFMGAMHYTSMAECMTSYGGTATANQSCRAGHLCNAAATGMTTTPHCQHAAGHVACM